MREIPLFIQLYFRGWKKIWTPFSFGMTLRFEMCDDERVYVKDKILFLRKYMNLCKACVLDFTVYEINTCELEVKFSKKDLKAIRQMNITNVMKSHANLFCSDASSNVMVSIQIMNTVFSNQ